MPAQHDALGDITCIEQHGNVTGTGCSAAPSNDATSPWRVRRFTYDSVGRLLTAKNPESGTISYTYDNDGNLLQKTSPAPNQTNPAVTQTISYCYDELHRVTGRAYGALSCPLASPVVSYIYDSGPNAIGKLVSMTDQAGTATYAYDILDRMSTETRTLTGANNGAISKTLSYEYNLDGSLAKLHYPSGAVVSYTPDSAGRITQAVDSGNGINYVTGATYGPDSSLTGFISGSGGATSITNSFNYNKRLQPVTMSATTPSQTVFSIGYDFHAGNGAAGSGTDNGNVWGITNYKDISRNQTFTYDLLNRVISAQNAGTNCAATTANGKTEYWGNSYSYDTWGNLIGKTITKCGAENLSVTADAHNWLHISPNDYQYDAAGNMTYDATANLNYTFDQENRISDAAGYTYTYDDDGNRVRKSNGNLAGNGTLYWYMTPGIMAETDLAGTTKSEYIFFGGERVARRDGVNGAGGVFYYFSDHLKTASIITDSAGTIKAESDYYPWGGELQLTANDSNHYKFTGKERDGETGLDYFGARYYSNALGRFMTPDWAAKAVDVPYAEFSDPQSLNLYTYVRNVPTTRADADGHCPCAAVFGEWLDKQLSKFESTTIGKIYSAVSATSPMPAANPVAVAHFVADSANIGTATGSAFGGNHNTMEKVDAIAHDVTAAANLTIVLATAGKSVVPAGGIPRLPQDVNVNPNPPAANGGNGTVGPSGTQNAAVQGDVAAARAAGHTDIRVNQQQVSANGERVGINRPDLQSTDANGQRHYTEYDRSAQNAADHHARTTANDPNAVTHTKIIR